jgi:hypothetical protein
MSSLGTRLSNVTRQVVGAEAHLFLAYAVITFRPSAAPPRLPAQAATQPRPVPTDWTAEEYKLFIEEARIDVASQQADKRDIRARAQVILTTAIVLGGILVTSFSGKHDLCLGGKVLYGIAGLAVLLAGLAAGGIISARSEIGTVSVTALTHYDTGELQKTVAEGYGSTRMTGAETVSVLVTVLRDCVLSLVLGAALLALAHLTQ